MKITKYIMSVATLALGACSVEAPFQADSTEDMGTFLKSSLALDVRPGEVQVRSNSVDAADFTVDFLMVDGTVKASYIYSEMPEVVKLPYGSYSVCAHLGENVNADWEAPYYEGVSKTFDVAKDKVTILDPIVCTLANVKVSVIFDSSLGDSKDFNVNVSLSNSAALDFSPANGDKAGYFKYVEGSTLIAKFSGTIEGELINEIKTYSKVEPGHHYKMTFKLSNPNTDGNGDIQIGTDDQTVNVDATVNISNLTGEGNDNISPDPDDESMTDIRFPEEDPGTGGDEPTPPTPVDPVTPGSGPVVTAREPIDLSINNKAFDGLQCILDVTSETGITGFTVKIKSKTLTADILKDVGLSDSFDLVTGMSLDGTDADLTEGLTGLDLPVGDQVKNQKSVKFDVSAFMGLLGIYGEANHEFTLTVTDASGSTVTTLKLYTE